MAGNRKAATARLLELLAAYPATKEDREVNLAATKAFLEGMTDKEFEQYVDDIAEGRAYVRFCKKNFGDHKHDKDLIAAFEPMYKKLGYPIFQRYWYTDTSTGEGMVSKFPGLLLYAPDRMLNQMIVKKRRYAKDNQSIDELTGQATGKSRASTFSAPEAIVSMGKGHKYLSMDFMKFRGGDERVYQMATQEVYQNGTYSIDALLEHETNVTSTVMYSVILDAMHYANNIWREPRNGQAT